MSFTWVHFVIFCFAAAATFGYFLATKGLSRALNDRMRAAFAAHPDVAAGAALGYVGMCAIWPLSVAILLAVKTRGPRNYGAGPLPSFDIETQPLPPEPLPSEPISCSRCAVELDIASFSCVLSALDFPEPTVDGDRIIYELPADIKSFPLCRSCFEGIVEREQLTAVDHEVAVLQTEPP